MWAQDLIDTPTPPPQKDTEIVSGSQKEVIGIIRCQLHQSFGKGKPAVWVHIWNPVLRRMRQEDLKYKTNLGYSISKTKQNKKSCSEIILLLIGWW